MTLPAPTADRTAIVTGASSGIGADLARNLARRGHGVTLVARREERLRTLADELSAAHGIRAEVVVADLTDADSRDSIAATMAERGLIVDVLANNAGLSTLGTVADSTPESEITMIRTNVEAVVHLCSLFVPGMVERRRGAVLNVASTAAFQPIPGQAGYGATKSFVLSYTHAMRAELAGTGVSVTTLCPGPVHTEFAEVAGVNEADAMKLLPKPMWLSSVEVADQAIAGLDKNRAVVIPGLANRATAQFAYLTPRSVLMPIMAKLHPGAKGT